MEILSSNVENLNYISSYNQKINYIPDVEYISPHGIKMGLLSNINESLSVHHLIYKIYNIINGKYYIGQHKTTNPFDYYMGSGDAIIMAEKKYGLSSFIKIILFDFDNFNDMNNKEQELVNLSNCWPYDQMSYNIRCGGSSQVNPLTIEKCLSTKSIHGISYKGENNPMYGISPQERMSPEIFNGWLKNLHNYHPTDEVKNKISKSLRGRKITSEHKEKISKALRGKSKNLSDDQRKKIAARTSAMFKNVPKTDEHKQKIGLGNKGKVRSEECKQHMREIMVGRKASDEARHKMSIARKGKKFSKEHSEKISKNNGMHGHSVIDFMTETEVKLWKQHISENSRGRKKMYNPITDHLVSVKQNEFQKYLDLGYHFGSRPKKPKAI